MRLSHYTLYIHSCYARIKLFTTQCSPKIFTTSEWTIPNSLCRNYLNHRRRPTELPIPNITIRSVRRTITRRSTLRQRHHFDRLSRPSSPARLVSPIVSHSSCCTTFTPTNRPPPHSTPTFLRRRRHPPTIRPRVPRPQQ